MMGGERYAKSEILLQTGRDPGIAADAGDRGQAGPSTGIHSPGASGPAIMSVAGGCAGWISGAGMGAMMSDLDHEHSMRRGTEAGV